MQTSDASYVHYAIITSAMRISIKAVFLLVLLGSLTANIYLALQLHKNAVLETNMKASEKVKPSMTPPATCTYDLRLADAEKELGDNQAAINLIKQKCMWLFGSLEADLEGTGKKGCHLDSCVTKCCIDAHKISSGNPAFLSLHAGAIFE